MSHLRNYAIIFGPVWLLLVAQQASIWAIGKTDRLILVGPLLLFGLAASIGIFAYLAWIVWAAFFS